MMNNQELIVNSGNIPEVINNLVSLGTLQAIKPVDLISGASEMARELAKIIEKQRLFTVIQGKKFVNVEGWTTLATMLGCVAREVETIENEGVYIAIVELVRLSDGFRIGKASAECGEESPWNKRNKYARRSMAQTRATSKACRLAFSWIMQLSGYEVTPAEEMLIEKGAKPLITVTQLRIDGQQLQGLKAKISAYGLSVERVENWIKTAWHVESLQFLTPEQFAKLLPRLDQWAAQEYEKAQAVTALHPDFDEQPLRYAEIRG